jgi:diguanylate cyclase (GGDEF)-like protein/PAS domain S-box-containing protein
LTDLKLDETTLRTVIEAAPCAMILVDDNGSIALVNRATERLFGYDRNMLLGKPIEILVPEAARKAHHSHRQRFSDVPDARPMGKTRDLMARHRDGTDVPVEVGLSPIQTPDGVFVLSAIVDLTERKRTERRMDEQAQRLAEVNVRLEAMAATDSLTSLWNRRAFLDQLGIQMESALRNGRPLSVLILDVDHFKPYNDHFGHLAGDEVLRRFANILLGMARRSDYVARLGGEEFGAVLPETDRPGAVRLGERFRTAIETVAWPKRPITASIGATTAHFTSQGPRPTSEWLSRLLMDADRALYYAKEHGRNRVVHVQDILQQT